MYLSTLKVIATAKYMYNHLTTNGYTLGEVKLSHDLGDHVASYMIFGNIALLPKAGSDPEQSLRAEALADLVNYYICKDIVASKEMLFGGIVLQDFEYDWYLSIMLKAPPPLLKSLKWWYRYLS
jgi:hypothetical protein